MNTTKFRRTALSTAILLASAGSITQLHAAESSTEKSMIKDVEVIQVTGMLGSLSKSAQMKRTGTGVVDAISAEDIGKFPDANLAESLQRITGVSIDRTNNEGNGVTVRGFGPDFNLVTLNGRQMPNSSALQSEGIDRSFNFNEISSDAVSAVEVFKTGRADLDSGGIGAVIDIQTAKPFDYDGFKATASVKAVVDTTVDNVTPEFSGMISNTFLDDTFGILVAASYAELNSESKRIGTQSGWNTNFPAQVAGNIDKSNINTALNPDKTTWGVNTVDSDYSHNERTRTNAQVALQWAPTDTIVASVEYFLSRLERSNSMTRSSFWFDNIETGTADANGTIINPARENDELNFWAWEYNFETKNDSLGLNIEWMATDSLTFTLDAHDSTSHSNPGAQPAESIANMKNPGQLVDISADFTSDMPMVGYDASALPGGDPYARENIVGDIYQRRGYEIENNIQQVALGGTWQSNGDAALEAIHFGVQNTVYTVDTTLREEANWNVSGMDLSELDMTLVPGEIGFQQHIDYSAVQFFDLLDNQNLLNDPTLKTNGMEEDTIAVYLAVDFITEIYDMTFIANLGVRYEDTDVTSYSVVPPVVGFNWITDLEMSEYVLPDTPNVSSNLSGDYTSTLPSVNLSLQVTNDLITRFSYSKTLSRSTIDAMFPATSLNDHFSTGPFRASQGNPGLLPYLADNFDFSLEYYYAEGSYASIGYFSKDVDNYIGTGEEDRVINGVNGPLTNPSINPRGICPSGSNSDPDPDCLSQPQDPAIIWTVTTPINQDSTTVDGWELNIQNIFGDTGFGAIANYTIVNTADEYDPYSLDNQFAITGLSDTANLVGFYENESFEIRVAYNWRDDFLLLAGSSPVFTEAYSQIDISASYDINDSVSIFIDGLNITEEDTRRHSRFSNQIVDFEQYGARYNVGVRAVF
ncbi:TonB-dependent receptor [Colwellia echini]|uniref:TonB-dependent receptor n=1 Tax=Colwellia echini TaxID=1982103 RepID=A0ABY3N1V1_9GAMM|nr:TonB-dependent receptor [Colwellia echini]